MTSNPNDILERNLKDLARHGAALAERVRSSTPPDALRPSRSGPPTASLPDAAGRPVQLASRIDPLREARRLVDAHLADGPTVYVVIGLGLGYHEADLLARRGGQDFILVAEPDPALIRSCLERFDWSQALARRALQFFTSADRPALYSRLVPLGAAILQGARLIVHPPSARLHPDFEAAFRGTFLDIIAAMQVDLTTLATHTYITVFNALNNLPVYAACQPIDHLAGAFRGSPAIIVSAGPSLARNIHLLGEARSRAVIIAVATTLKLLLDRGIEPHFVTCLDYHEVSKRFFEGVDPAVMTHLVMEPKATWHVADVWRGPVSVLGNDFLDACLRDADAPMPHDRLPAGSTVAHLAFYLARYLGADPIIFTGQDLGFSDGLYYMPGTAVHDTWRPDLNRFRTLESREWERIVRQRATLRTVDDVHGRPIYTDAQMFTYLQRFEMDFAETEARVIDATEGGARKAGAEVLPLAEALDRFAQRPVPADAIARVGERPAPDLGRARAAAEALRRRIAECEGIRDICLETLDLLDRMEPIIEDRAKAHPLFRRVDELRAAIDENSAAFLLVRAVGQIDQLRRFQADRTIAAAAVEGVAKQRRQIKRDRDYVGGLRDSADMLISMMESAIERLEAFVDQSGDHA